MTTVNLHQEAAAMEVEGPMSGEEQQYVGAALRTNTRGELAVTAAPSEVMFPETDELFRGIYTRAGTGLSAEVVAICSAISGEGKTTVGVGLAVAIAQDFPERRVLLVEIDLGKPVLADDFGVEASPGLVDCLELDEPLLSACRPTFLENLHIVPAGAVQPVRGRPLRSSRMASIVDAMRDSYDVVILDLPPILTNSDSVLLTDLADGVIVIVRAGVTPTALLNRAIEQLEPSKLRGIVLNGTGSAVPGWLNRVLGL